MGLPAESSEAAWARTGGPCGTRGPGGQLAVAVAGTKKAGGPEGPPAFATDWATW